MPSSWDPSNLAMLEAHRDYGLRRPKIDEIEVPDLIPMFDRIAVPILGIMGEKDPFPDRPELLAHLSSFREVVVPGSERFVQWERPAEFNAILEGFLEALDAS